MTTGEEEKEEDIISLLPDCLLLEIISRLDLSTKQVIKTTSTVSKRWQHLWTKLPTLSFTWPDDDVAPKDDYFSFIDKTLTQCPTDFNLTKFKLFVIINNTQPKLQVYNWIQHAITRNVQELDLSIHTRSWQIFRYDHELFFNNSSLMSMTLWRCAFSPPNGAIRWDKLKCLCINEGDLDEVSIRKILSGSPCLETLELDDCSFHGCLSKPLFENFSVERLKCFMDVYESFINGNGEFWDDLDMLSIKLSRCVFNPPNGWGNLNFLCIQHAKLYEDSIGKILSGSPCLETLELYCCHGVRRIDVASNTVKNLVLIDYGEVGPGYYIDTLEINAPHILSLTIKGGLEVEKILLLNISSLVKAELDYVTRNYFAEQRGRTLEDIEDELLKGILTNLGHVNQITLRNNCLEVSSRLKKKTGFHRVHLNWCHGFYLFIIILLFSFWVAMVSNRPFGLLIHWV